VQHLLLAVYGRFGQKSPLLQAAPAKDAPDAKSAKPFPTEL